MLSNIDSQNSQIYQTKFSKVLRKALFDDIFTDTHKKMVVLLSFVYKVKRFL